jgi:hypothetical protein
LSLLIRAIGALLGLALTLLIVLDMVRPQNPWTGRIKGEALRLLWDRQSPLECGGNAVMVLRGDSLDFKRGPVFEASGRCRLELIGVRARAPRVLTAKGDAHVIVEAGRLEATEAVVEASGDALVELRGTALSGPVRKADKARIEGADQDRPPPVKAPAGERVEPGEQAPPVPPAHGGKRKRPRRSKG